MYTRIPGLSCLIVSPAQSAYFWSCNDILNGNQDIYFNGCAAGALTYALKGWCVSSPQALNAVENDEGTVIKNMQNYMTSVWSKSIFARTVFHFQKKFHSFVGNDTNMTAALSYSIRHHHHIGSI